MNSSFKKTTIQNIVFSNKINREAIELYSKGETEKAISSITHAIDEGLESRYFYNTLGLIYLREDCPFNASMNFKKALNTDSGLGFLIENILVDYDRDQVKEVIKKHKEDSGLIHANLAEAYGEMGLVQKAVSEYKKAIQLGFSPNDVLVKAIHFCKEHNRYADSMYFSNVWHGLQTP